MDPNVEREWHMWNVDMMVEVNKGRRKGKGEGITEGQGATRVTKGITEGQGTTRGTPQAESRADPSETGKASKDRGSHGASTSRGSSKSNTRSSPTPTYARERDHEVCHATEMSVAVVSSPTSPKGRLPCIAGRNRCIKKEGLEDSFVGYLVAAIIQEIMELLVMLLRSFMLLQIHATAHASLGSSLTLRL